MAQPENKTEAGTFPLEADRLSIHFPVIECLCLLAGHYSRRVSPQSLLAGLPLPGAGEFPPSLIIRAAARADLSARMSRQTLASLRDALNLPCLLLLQDRQAAILWGRDEAGRLLLQFPETPGERIAVAFDDLLPRYSGYACFIRPEPRHDGRAGPAEIDPAQSWFWGTIRKNALLYRDVCLAALMINLFALVIPLFTMNVYDRVVPNSAFETLWVLAAGAAAVLIFDLLLKNLRAQFLDVAGRVADSEISARLFSQIMGMTMAARPSSAGVLASHVRDFDGLRDFFTSATLVALIDLPFVLVFLVLVGILGGPVVFVPLLIAPLVIAVSWVMQRKMQVVIRKSMNESAQKNAVLVETLSNLETVKVQAAEGHIQRKWEELADKSSRLSLESRRLSSFTLNFAAAMQQIASILVVAVGVYTIAAGNMTMGALVASVMLTGRALAPLSQIAGLLIRFGQSRESLRQLDSLMRKPVERPADRHFISRPQISGQIDFRSVTFHYPEQTVPALKDVSFSIAPGQKVGIIGAVGSGKTTLERLILNLYQPESGSVQIDGTDVRQIDPGDLRRAIGVVQQSPQLFYGTVRENITLGDETVDGAAVLRAAELAGVMDFLGDTRNGLDLKVGERGEALSGGQRQAIAVARALLYDPPIMIMDEPTAAMDPATENRLKVRLEKCCAGKTLILITHKSQLLGLIDTLGLMDRGRMVDFGPRDTILERLRTRQYGGDVA